MRILKPQHLSILHRCFERQHKAYLGISVLAFLPLEGSAALLSEQDLWQFAPPLLDPQTPLDIGIPKSGAEYLVVGDACAPGGTPVPGLVVEARVGNQAKTLHAVGPRYWAGRRATDPLPFARQSLGWTQAFGGPQFEDNPLGCGMAREETAAGSLQALPRLEYPRSPCRAPDEAVLPASFAPILPMWPARKRFAGTYDDAWLKSEYPGPPRDLDWRYHCQAPEDQWQAQPYAGNEPIELVHMHPDHPRIQAALPGIRAVVAVRNKGASALEARFPETRLTTVWLFPNQLRMVLVWHALLEVANEFADDIDLLLAAAEWSERPRPRDAYIRAINERLDEENGALKMLCDEELLPEGMATPNPLLEKHLAAMGDSGVSVSAVTQKLQEAETELHSRLQALGPTAVAEAQTAIAAAKRSLGLPEVPTQVPRDPFALAQMGQNLLGQLPGPDLIKQTLGGMGPGIKENVLREFAAQGHDRAALDALANTAPPRAPGRVSLSQEVAALEAKLASLPQQPGVATPAVDSRIKAMLADSEKAIAAMQRGVAHMQPPPAPLDGAAAGRWREGAQRAKAAGRSFAGLKLIAADFSGMDLSGVDFTEAELEGANLSNANLVGAVFVNASLAHAVLDGAQLDGADFSGANLGRARLVGVQCRRAIFKDATLHYTVLDEAVLAGSVFAGVTLIEIVARRADWSETQLAQTTFVKCQLEASVFRGAATANGTFLECVLNGADFSSARLDATDFVTCVIDQGIFDGCTGQNVRFVYRSSLRQASFKGACVPGSNFRGLALDGANFSEAQADGCDFSEAQCPNARFYRASLKGALLMKGNFQHTVFVGANLMQAILQHAQLQGADLRDANLYAADLMRVDADPDTRLDNAFIAKARLHPQRKAGAPATDKGA